MNDKIAQCVITKFNNLKKSGKPNQTQWTVLAGIVEYNDTDMRCVAIGTGTKCLPKSKLESDGQLVFDSHAEVLARRCLKRYLLSYKDLLPNAKYAMYTSHAPCGDASQLQLELEFQGKESTEEPLKKKQKVEIKRGREDHTLIGSLRTKPGRTDAEPTIQMSCSDKIAMWLYCGFGGSLTNCSLTHLIIGDYYHPYIYDSLITRTGASPIIIEGTTVAFQHARKAGKKPVDSSITWCLGEDQQVLVNGRRQGAAKKNGSWSEKSRSMVCKYELCKLVQCQKYLEKKKSNLEYQQRKQELLSGKFSGWIRKEYLSDFKVN